MKIHILGICGTFMGGIAMLAKELGHQVSGSDMNVYPPMSTQLEQGGIDLVSGYDPDFLQGKPDLVIIGNTLSRGNAAVEAVLDAGQAYTSGPQWLADQVLRGRHVVAVSGTHGKTTTTSMLAWVLEYAGRDPGFLIGGVAENFKLSARLGGGDSFVVEADEYDTAFFDKRPKFIHYRPRTLIINNIEFDHADIFGDIDDIIREFHRLLRIVPCTGRLVIKAEDAHIGRVLQLGSWTPAETFGIETGDWQLQGTGPAFSGFDVSCSDQSVATVNWSLIGRHNAENALAVFAATRHLGVDPATTARALAGFQSVKRRMQRLAVVNGIAVYDDFAHHPTAIQASLSALRSSIDSGRIFAVFEPRSNTMKLGVHQAVLAASFTGADRVLAYQPSSLAWDLNGSMASLGDRYQGFTGTDQIIDSLHEQLRSGDHVLIMSNGGFEGIHRRLIDRLEKSP